MMNDRQRQTEFLRQCLLFDDSREYHTLAERIGQLQQKERCVHRAVWLMSLLAALALVGFGYLGVFSEEFPRNPPGFIPRFITQACSVLGLSSTICILAFGALEIVYRKELDHLREEGRRLATRLLESRLGKPEAVLHPRLANTPEIIGPSVSSSDRELAHGAAGVSSC